MSKPAYSDLVKRTANTDANKLAANTWGDETEIDDIIKFRFDAQVWNNAPEELRVRAMVSAYRDIDRLSWDSSYGTAQNRDYSFGGHFNDPNDPPIDDTDFMNAILHAQAAQIMFILNGTQVRDMARIGIRMTKTLSNSEMEITGYSGAVCAEAREFIAKWIELMPRRRRMA